MQQIPHSVDTSSGFRQMLLHKVALTLNCSPLFAVTDNINDNLPIFSPTTYQWFVSEGATVGTSVGKVTATDADVGTLGDISYR
jgi:hypothetical protein